MVSKLFKQLFSGSFSLAYREVSPLLSAQSDCVCEDGGGGKGRGSVAGHAVLSAAVNGPFKLCAVVSSHS